MIEIDQVHILFTAIYVYIGHSHVACATSWMIARNRQKIYKTPILAFKVIQGHWIRCQSKASVRFLQLDLRILVYPSVLKKTDNVTINFN